MLRRKDDLLNFMKVIMYSWKLHQQLKLVEWQNQRNSLLDSLVLIKFLKK